MNAGISAVFLFKTNRLREFRRADRWKAIRNGRARRGRRLARIVRGVWPDSHNMVLGYVSSQRGPLGES